MRYSDPISLAEQVGYLSVKHFSYVFKNHYHMPPSEFQEMHHAKLKHSEH
ncbi:MAG: hypothetical protein WD469_08125 [Paenibacillaceae bacterium]